MMDGCETGRLWYDARTKDGWLRDKKITFQGCVSCKAMLCCTGAIWKNALQEDHGMMDGCETGRLRFKGV